MCPSINTVGIKEFNYPEIYAPIDLKIGNYKVTTTIDGSLLRTA